MTNPPTTRAGTRTFLRLNLTVISRDVIGFTRAVIWRVVGRPRSTAFSSSTTSAAEA